MRSFFVTQVGSVFVPVAVLLVVGCGTIPERLPRDDARLTMLFEAMARVDRVGMGFTPVSREADIRLEGSRRGSYDAMLHVSGKTSRTVAFKRAYNGYEWVGEQE